MKHLVFLFALFSATAPLSAQFIIGWSAGYGDPQELNREIYLYNAINKSGLTKEMNEVHWNQGLAIGVRSPTDVFFELLYSRKRIKVHSEFDSAGVAFERQLKVLSNTLNFGMGVQDEKWAFGMSFDLGRFKGRGRRGAASSIGDKEYTDLWVLDDSRFYGIKYAKLYAGLTAFAELRLGLFAARFYVQWMFSKNQMDGLEYWLFNENLNFEKYEMDKYSSAGLMLSFQFGGR